MGRRGAVVVIVVVMAGVLLSEVLLSRGVSGRVLDMMPSAML